MISVILVVVGIILVGLAGISEAIMDKLIFHYDNSIFKSFNNQKYWDPELSWVNKYKKDLVTERFMFSTTILVFLTDAWHFLKFVRTLFMFVGLVIIGANSLSIFHIIIFTIIARIVFGVIFEYFFKHVFNI
jgi:hypothetical protein